MDVSRIREQFPTVGAMTYLNTGWSGPSPIPVVEAVKKRLEYESYSGPTSPAVLETGNEICWQAKESVASLLNAAPQEILLTECTTDGLNVVMNGLPWQEGDEIITCDLEHPSVLLPSYHLRERRGVNVRVISVAPAESEEVIISKVEDAITDRTRMLFVSHVEYSTGLRMPVKELSKLARPRGIWILLDGAQGPGHVPVDVRDIDCDFYAMPGQKWLLGPDQTGALYIREEMIPRISPIRVGFGSVLQHDHAGNFVPNTKDIEKFRVGTISAPLRAGFVEGIRFVRDAGIDRIEKRDLALAATLKSCLGNVPGVCVLSPMEGPGCSGLVSFEVKGVDHQKLADALWENDRIVVRAIPHPSSIRTSLHFFNTEEEAVRLAEVVRILMRHL